MAKDNLIIGIDLGTSCIRVVVSETGQDRTQNIIGVGTSTSTGIKKGAIVDLDQTINAITEAVADAERMVGERITSAYIGIMGNHASVINNRGVVAVAGEDKEITREDVERVRQASKVMALPPDREIIDIVAKEYIVDGYDGIRDPVGMIGIRLEIDALIITGSVSVLRNTVRCVERAGITVNGLILNPLADAEIALTRDDRELGVAMMNIGAGTTEISVFQNGTLQFVNVITIGGDHITNDIAVMFRMTLQEAENLKLEHGTVLLDEAEKSRDIAINRLGRQEEEKISQDEVAAVIEPRVAEIIQLSMRSVVNAGFENLPAGVVITGGTANLPGVLSLAEEYFLGPARMASPTFVGVKNPSFSTSVGILKYVRRMNMVPFQARKGLDRRSDKKNIFTRIRDWFIDFLE